MAIAAAPGLERRLRREIAGEVLFDAFSRGRYATDASIYQMMPVGVVVPETLDDVRETLDFIVDLDPFSAVLMVWIDDYEALDPELRARRLVLRREIEAILLENKDRYPHWSVPGLRINFDARLFHHLRRAGKHGPLWQHSRGPVVGFPVQSGHSGQSG